MSSEWMKVMLEEIARKRAEAEQAGVEEQHRADERRRCDDLGCGDEPADSARSGNDRARG